MKTTVFAVALTFLMGTLGIPIAQSEEQSNDVELALNPKECEKLAAGISTMVGVNPTTVPPPPDPKAGILTSATGQLAPKERVDQLKIPLKIGEATVTRTSEWNGTRYELQKQTISLQTPFGGRSWTDITKGGGACAGFLKAVQGVKEQLKSE